jgi:membrane-associated phospholipid phosphatase
MSTMLHLQFNLEFVEFLANHRNIYLTKLFLAASFVGEAWFYLLIIMLIYVIWDKQLAMRVSVLVLLTMSLNDLLKILIKNPRPFIREGTYLQKWAVSAADARNLAAEYSTPSGHAMGAAAFYSYLFAFIRNRWVRAAAVLAIVLIGFSRPYLGVHYGEDVLIGWAIGLFVAIAAAKCAGQTTAYWNRRSYSLQVAITVTAGLGFCLLAVALNGWRLDSQPRAMLAYAGFLTGNVIARPLELRMVNFDPRSSIVVAKVMRLLMTIGIILFTSLSLKTVFSALADPFSVPGYLLEYIRYAAVGFAGMFLAPYVFKKTKLAETKPAESN